MGRGLGSEDTAIYADAVRSKTIIRSNLVSSLDGLPTVRVTAKFPLSSTNKSEERSLTC